MSMRLTAEQYEFAVAKIEAELCSPTPRCPLCASEMFRKVGAGFRSE